MIFMSKKIEKIRTQFPILKQLINGKPLVYLDNAATTQKPKRVIEAIGNYYTTSNAAVYRGVHTLSERATALYENARTTVREFINAKLNEEIIFVRGTTEAINLVAQSYGKNFKANDEIIITALEHHSNIVPWQMIAEKTKAKLQVVALTDDHAVDLNHYKKLLNERTKIVAITHVSNALGNVLPIKEMINLARQLNIPVLVDGAQAIAHLSVDVQDLDCDFYVFSGHKMYAPDGIGVLYGKTKLLEKMPPYQGGGGMIKTVNFTKTTYADLPQKFEAGTPNVSGAIGLMAAIEFLKEVGTQIFAHEENLTNYAKQKLAEINELKIIGIPPSLSVISFTLDKIHPHDAGTILNSEGIAIRAGHHCAMPLMEYLGLAATTRASFGAYNTEAEVDILVAGIKKVLTIFRKKKF